MPRPNPWPHCGRPRTRRRSWLRTAGLPAIARIHRAHGHRSPTEHSVVRDTLRPRNPPGTPPGRAAAPPGTSLARDGIEELLSERPGPRTCPVCAYLDWIRVLELRATGGLAAAAPTTPALPHRRRWIGSAPLGELTTLIGRSTCPRLRPTLPRPAKDVNAVGLRVRLALEAMCPRDPEALRRSSRLRGDLPVSVGHHRGLTPLEIQLFCWTSNEVVTTSRGT